MTKASRNPRTSKLAIACCSSAIISVAYFPVSLLPIILGHMALSEHKKKPELKGRDLALVGICVGYSLLVISVIMYAAAIWIFSDVTIEKYIAD